MEEYKMYSFVCPHCQKIFMKRIARIVIVDKEEERLKLIPKIRNVDNYINDCPYCNYTFPVGKCLFYFDNVAKISLIYIPNINNLDDYLNEVEEHKEYKNRLVIGDTLEYSEKFDIMYSGLNDKIIELYRYKLKKDLKTNYVHFDLVGEKLLVSVKVNDKIITKPLLKSLYDDLYERALNYNFLERDNDYIVNEIFAEIIFNSHNKIPVHVAMKNKREKVAIVKIYDTNEKLYYKADNDLTDVDVFVYVGKEIKKGHIIKIALLTEAEIGIRFDELVYVYKYIYPIDKYKDILNDLMEDINNYTVSYKDAKITRNTFDNYKLHETIRNLDTILSFIDESKCKSNCRYIIVSPKKRIHISTNKMIRTMNIRNVYYKVIGKEEIDGIYFIILLALSDEDAIFINNDVKISYEDYKPIYDKTIKYITAASNSTYLLDLKDINDYKQVIGFSLRTKLTAIDRLFVTDVINNE